jgi:signal transduction histidine kinase/DNA-binding NarL/FixJ family response regulator
MSLKTNLLLMFGLFLAVLTISSIGFYWNVEQSLADQALVAQSQEQLIGLQMFSTAVYRQAKEIADALVLGRQGFGDMEAAMQIAESRLHRIEKINAQERVSAGKSGREASEAEEAAEYENYKKLEAAYTDLCDVSGAVASQYRNDEKGDVSSLSRRLDAVFDRGLVLVLNDMIVNEVEQLRNREQTMFHSAHISEFIAVATCLASLIIAVLGVSLLRRSLYDIARKEGAEAANFAKSEFLAHMSHEIRTPMTAILGFANILAEDLVEPEKIEAAATITRNGEYLLNIINDILDLSKIDAAKLDVKREPCSPWHIVAEVFSLMRVRAAAKGIELIVEHKGSIPETILTGPVRLRQILINLVGNAIKFTEIGSVRLETQLVRGKTGEPQLRFDVIDTGIGIPQEGINNLFKPFTQINSLSSEKDPGTGLGLIISQRLAELLGGTITVASAPGKGSTFSVTIQTGPLDGVKMLEHPGEILPRPDALGRETVKHSISLHGRVLLAEDGPDNQRLIAFLLKKAGADVTIAENGQVALDKVMEVSAKANQWQDHGTAAPFDVILMDMQMPVMDGYEATRRLRQMGYKGAIVALTAYAMSTDRQKCLDAGCNDYAIKPITPYTLLKTLARHMRTQPESKQEHPKTLDESVSL